MITAHDELRAALDRFNIEVLGLYDEGDLVEAREEQLDAVEALAQKFLLEGARF